MSIESVQTSRTSAITSSKFEQGDDHNGLQTFLLNNFPKISDENADFYKKAALTGKQLRMNGTL